MTIFLIALLFGLIVQVFSVPADYGKIIPDVIKSRNFVEETHYITTEDGYILTTYRIVNPIAKKELKTPKPIILAHGLIGTGNDFLVTDAGGQLNEKIFKNRDDLSRINFNVEGNNLGFILANLGYDIWLPQYRGIIYSLNHTTLDPQDKKFWEFSFDEIALLDNPAVIKYIQKETGHTEIGYIGHSQGSTIMFALLAEKPDFSNIIKPFIALGPAVLIPDASGSLHRTFASVIVQKMLLTKGGECFGPNNYTKNIINYCNGTNLSGFCKNLIYGMVGMNPKSTNLERIPVYIWNDPSGTSCWNGAHFGQLMNKPKFAKLDFGWFDNWKHYHSHSPPEYHLDKITSTNIALFYGPADETVCTKDVDLLKSKLKGTIYPLIMIHQLINLSFLVPLLLDYKIPNPNWNHLDHIFSNQTGIYQNSIIANLLKKKLI